MPCTTGEYLTLAAWTGEQVRPGAKAESGGAGKATPENLDAKKADPQTARVLRRVHLNDRQWLWQVRGIGSRYWRMIGYLEHLKRKAEELEQRWLKVSGHSRPYFPPLNLPGNPVGLVD